jgi:hypothetical protein
MTATAGAEMDRDVEMESESVMKEERLCAATSHVLGAL